MSWFAPRSAGYASAERRSVRALIRSNSSLLAAKVAERSPETGEHYITRDRAEYKDMLRKASGGGAFMSITTLVKFGVMALGAQLAEKFAIACEFVDIDNPV